MSKEFIDATKSLIDYALTDHIIDDIRSFSFNMLELLNSKELSDEEILNECKIISSRHNSPTSLSLYLLATFAMIQEELNIELTERLLNLSIKEQELRALVDLSVLLIIKKEISKAYKTLKEAEKNNIEAYKNVLKSLEENNCITDDSELVNEIANGFNDWRLNVMRRDIKTSLNIQE